MEVIAIILAVVGIGAGFGTSQVVMRRKIGSAADEAEKQLAKANKESTAITRKAQEDAAKNCRRHAQKKNNSIVVN